MVCLRIPLVLSFSLLSFMHSCCGDTIGFIKRTDVEPKASHYNGRPRGVPLFKGPLYNTGEEFTCFDGSKTIAYSKVNDDYCDCPDGSDEPGTSACSNGVFHCLNLGYKAEDIPSSRVNDQICDCCDGSDEWNSAVDCPNICEKVGEKYREEVQRKAAVIQKGFEKRSALVAEGGKLKEEKSKGIDALKKERDDLIPIRENLEAKKKDLEEKEREIRDKHTKLWEETRKEKKRAKAKILFDKLDLNLDGKITVEEVQKKLEFDTDKNGEVTADEAKDYLSGNEEVDFDNFVENSYDLVKLLFEEKKKETVESKEREEGKFEEKEEVKKEEETKGEEKPDETGEEENIKVKDETADEGEEEDYEKMPPYDEESNSLFAAAEEARKEFNEVDSKYRDLESNIRDAETFLNGDYGEDDVWASLKGHCVEMDESQYTYRLCLFDKAIQKERNGHIETNLGYWHEWSGGDANKYSEQLYNKGQQCWNGPERSTKVVIECGEETALVEATEPAKCEYRFVLTSPAACPDPASLVQHEEL